MILSKRTIESFKNLKKEMSQEDYEKFIQKNIEQTYAEDLDNIQEGNKIIKYILEERWEDANFLLEIRLNRIISKMKGGSIIIKGL